MDKIQSVILTESTQIIENLFVYLESLSLGNKMCLEYLRGGKNELVVKQIPGSCKTKTNIVGGYEAELPFAVYSYSKVPDTTSIIDITKPLNDLAMIFENETNHNFPVLNIGKFIPLRIEMISTPSDVTGKEDGGATFMAQYKLTYKKKSKYE